MHKGFLKSVISELLVLVCLLGAVGCEKRERSPRANPRKA